MDIKILGEALATCCRSNSGLCFVGKGNCPFTVGADHESCMDITATDWVRVLAGLEMPEIGPVRSCITCGYFRAVLDCTQAGECKARGKAMQIDDAHRRYCDLWNLMIPVS